MNAVEFSLEIGGGCGGCSWLIWGGGEEKAGLSGRFIREDKGMLGIREC